MEVSGHDYFGARDRALRAVVTADTFDKAQAAWRLAKAHNRCAREKCRAEGGGDYATLPPGRARVAGETTLGDARKGLV